MATTIVRSAESVPPALEPAATGLAEPVPLPDGLAPLVDDSAPLTAGLLEKGGAAAVEGAEDTWELVCPQAANATPQPNSSRALESRMLSTGEGYPSDCSVYANSSSRMAPQ